MVLPSSIAEPIAVLIAHTSQILLVLYDTAQQQQWRGQNQLSTTTIHGKTDLLTGPGMNWQLARQHRAI